MEKRPEVGIGRHFAHMGQGGTWNNWKEKWTWLTTGFQTDQEIE